MAITLDKRMMAGALWACLRMILPTFLGRNLSSFKKDMTGFQEELPTRLESYNTSMETLQDEVNRLQDGVDRLQDGADRLIKADEKIHVGIEKIQKLSLTSGRAGKEETGTATIDFWQSLV
ncbi:hypothetical protein MMC20_005353 [Loxospora ochrophaea]|nr:hypothetical protein [Loxospora ochrophaea]